MSLPAIRQPILPLACLTLLVAGCAGPEGYPSLARRPAERVAGAQLPPCTELDCRDCGSGRVSASALPMTPETESAPPPPVTSDPAIEARLASLLAQARAAHARFRTRQAPTERALAAAAGAAIASDAWSTGAIALAELESARNDASVALSGIDSIHAADSLAHPSTPGPDTAAILAAREEAVALLAEEEAVLARLRPRLRG